jgi:hypothetical protein
MSTIQTFFLKQFASWSKWAILRMIGTMPKEKDKAQTWLLNLCKNRLLPLALVTETKLDDTAVEIVQIVASNNILWSLVWDQINSGEAIPVPVVTDNKKVGLLRRISNAVVNRVGSTGAEASEAETESIATAVMIVSLIANAKPALENTKVLLQNFLEKIRGLKK